MNKETNPLFAIARDKHKVLFNEMEFDFLYPTWDNEQTYVLGFANGVSHATAIWQKEIEALQKQVADLQKQPA